MAEAIIGGLGVVLIAGWLLLRHVNNVPTCICNRPDCGGGCIGKRKK